MNDVGVGVFVISSNEKVNKHLFSISLIQPCYGILQRPVYTCGSDGT